MYWEPNFGPRGFKAEESPWSRSTRKSLISLIEVEICFENKPQFWKGTRRNLPLESKRISIEKKKKIQILENFRFFLCVKKIRRKLFQIIIFDFFLIELESEESNVGNCDRLPSSLRHQINKPNNCFAGIMIIIGLHQLLVAAQVPK